MVEEHREPEFEPVARSTEGVETVDDVVETTPELVEDADEEEELVTLEEFTEAMSELGKRAKRAGIQPLLRMVSDYATRTVKGIDAMFAPFEDDDTGKKKKGK